MQIVELAPAHAKEATQLHIAGQPGTFLTSLGPDVLMVVYGALPRMAAGFGYVAVEGPADAGNESAYDNATCTWLRKRNDRYRTPVCGDGKNAV